MKPAHYAVFDAALIRQQLAAGRQVLDRAEVARLLVAYDAAISHIARLIAARAEVAMLLNEVADAMLATEEET